MSQMFDALQRSESERSGTDPAKFSAAADLLEVAERQVAQFAAEGDRPPTTPLQTENGHPPHNVRVDQFANSSR